MKNSIENQIIKKEKCEEDPEYDVNDLCFVSTSAQEDSNDFVETLIIEVVEDDIPTDNLKFEMDFHDVKSEADKAFENEDITSPMKEEDIKTEFSEAIDQEYVPLSNEKEFQNSLLKFEVKEDCEDEEHLECIEDVSESQLELVKQKISMFLMGILKMTLNIFLQQIQIQMIKSPRIIKTKFDCLPPKEDSSVPYVKKVF
ncbi:hypothetical protein JTB14_036777 [Gonioctena quinquepunctata]|nr:hypothetical protein JTB14_036777 [Gonioctena quinquepunctata]